MSNKWLYLGLGDNLIRFTFSITTLTTRYRVNCLNFTENSFFRPNVLNLTCVCNYIRRALKDGFIFLKNIFNTYFLTQFDQYPAGIFRV